MLRMIILRKYEATRDELWWCWLDSVNNISRWQKKKEMRKREREKENFRGIKWCSWAHRKRRKIFQSKNVKAYKCTRFVAILEFAAAIFRCVHSLKGHSKRPLLYPKRSFCGHLNDLCLCAIFLFLTTCRSTPPLSTSSIVIYFILINIFFLMQSIIFTHCSSFCCILVRKIFIGNEFEKVSHIVRENVVTKMLLDELIMFI